MNYEYRAYLPQIAPGVDGELKQYRFSGRALSGTPNNVQFYDWNHGWEDCPNVNIQIRIQKEVICPDNQHNHSRLTVSTWHCKDCGLVYPAPKN